MYISLITLILVIITIERCPVFSNDIKLNSMEEDLLYSYLKTPANVRIFYEKLLQSNDIDDISRLHDVITQENIKQLDVEHKCFTSSDDLLNALNIKSRNMNDSLSRNDIRRLLPALANVKFNDGCHKSEGRATWRNILIGLMIVTFINCSALCGAVILPFRNRAAFKWILTGFIGLAVGTLTGSGMFHLIPMAFNIPDLDVHHSYLNKSLIPIIIIYLYYMRDQLLRIFLHVETIVCTHTHEENEILAKPSRSIDGSKHELNKSEKKSVLEIHNPNTLVGNLKKMKAAGWMIIIGDMLHNFIDGLTLGAAFMVSIGEGLRMCFPIICEEFPHELGDIAVLLSSGLTIGQALLMNFLSACSCYLGFLIGAKLGELEQFHPWVYALAGGMFVYIGLADMIPELVSMGDEIEKDYLALNQPITNVLKLKILLCQNSGLILGFIIMFILGKYGGDLEGLVKF
ncbi:unnamed protein product [Adineta ricciae]|uniref:Uncharacterized protein n=1 Tax=Adineta ricciae TaxID=249248 RepID=A0A814HKG3_ADIRI|nr:unnamed protein product [Adineta ricciae]